jgi:hypothetical protein
MIVPDQIGFGLLEHPHISSTHSLDSHTVRSKLCSRSENELIRVCDDVVRDDIVAHKVDPEDPITPPLEVASVASNKRSM